MHKNITITIQEKNNAYYLIDSTGRICGVHASKEIAEKAKTQTVKNINNGFVHSWLLKTNKNNSKQTRQSYKNKWTKNGKK